MFTVPGLLASFVTGFHTAFELIEPEDFEVGAPDDFDFEHWNHGSVYLLYERPTVTAAAIALIPSEESTEQQRVGQEDINLFSYTNIG
jgi:hypothetical protein